MHSHVSHLQMHFVDTMHSEAYTFTYICTHSDAFDTVRILTHSYAYRSFPLLSLFCPTVRITTHSDAFVCILMHLMADALERIRTHSYAFLCIRVQVRHEDPLQLGVLGGLLVGAAHLLGDVADILGLDVAVLVAQRCVLILL